MEDRIAKLEGTLVRSEMKSEEKMGQVYVDLNVRGHKGEKRIENILVDTGATYSFLPKDLLESIGALNYHYKTKIELGNGKDRC